MIAAALNGEADQYVAAFVDEVDEDGMRLVVRNGHARERKLTVGSGTVPIRAPGSTTSASTTPASGAGSA